LLLRTKVDFIHDESLRGGELIYSLYKFADAITATVARQIPKVQVLYIGPRDVAAKFAITLNGVPKGVIMNAVQQQYFADVTVDFLSASSSGNAVLDLQVDEQIGNDGSIQVVGKLLGASNFPVSTYANGLESAFREGRDMYIQKLFLDKLRPHPINQIGGTEFFEGIVSVGGRVDIDTEAPSPAPESQNDGGGGGGSPALIIGIVAAACSLLLTGLTCWYRRSKLLSRSEKKRRRALRQEAKEELLEHDEDPEQTQGFRENVPHASEGRLTIVAGDADTNAPLQLTSHQSCGASVAISRDEISCSGETSADHTAERIPTSEGATQDREERSTAVVPDQLAIVEEVASSGNQDRRPQVRSKSFDSDSTGETPRRRAPPKATKSLDGNEFSDELAYNRAHHKSRTASEAPVSIGASQAALSRFMKAQPKSSVNKMSGSRSVMSQSRELLGDMFRNLKEAEAAPPEGGSFVGNPRRRKKPSATKSLDGNEFRDMLVRSREDDAPSVLLEGDSPQKRAPPKATKSLDENEFTSRLGANDVFSLRKIDKDNSLPSSAPENVPPDAQTKFTNLHSKSSTKKAGSSGSVQYQPPKAREEEEEEEEVERYPLGSQMKGTQLRASKLFGGDSPDDSSKRRAPPKSTKSLDGNEFTSQLGRNQASFLHKIDHGGVNLGTAFNDPTSAQLKNSPPAVPSESRKVRPSSSDNPMTSSRSVQLKPSVGKTALTGPPRKRAPDKNEFKSQLGRNQVSSHDNIDEGSDKRGTASSTPTPAKVKGFPPVPSLHLQPSFGYNVSGGTPHKRRLPKHTKSLDAKAFKSRPVQYTIPYLASKIDNDESANAFKTLTMVDTGPQSESSEHSGYKPGPGGSPRRRTPPKATKSLDGSEFKWQLDDNRVTKSQDGNTFTWQLNENRVTPADKIDNGKRGTVSNAKVKGFPAAA
jgi:hypothetical protein